MTRGYVRDIMESTPIVGTGRKAPRKKAPDKYRDQSDEGRKARLKRLKSQPASFAEAAAELREARLAADLRESKEDNRKFKRQPEPTGIGPTISVLRGSKPLNRYSKIAFGCVSE
jgi:hypothetical protein